MKTFYIHIDLGDLIYSLYFAKRLGVENYIIDADAGICKFNRAAKEFIIPLISHQKYIKSIQDFEGQSFDFNYGSLPDGEQVVVGTNLVEYHASKFKIDHLSINTPWIEAPVLDFGKKIVINRTPRYQDNFYFYHDFLRHVDPKDCVFVGIESEWREFTALFRKNIDFYKCASALDLASAINGCETFLGNQSLSCAIATGLGKNCLVEVGVGCANYIFNSKKIVYF